MQNISNVVIAATEISKANLKNDHKITTNIQYKNADGTWHDIICNYICYTNDGKKYPAYCIKHGVHGVDEEGAYTVQSSLLWMPEQKKVRQKRSPMHSNKRQQSQWHRSVHEAG